MSMGRAGGSPALMQGWKKQSTFLSPIDRYTETAHNQQLRECVSRDGLKGGAFQPLWMVDFSQRRLLDRSRLHMSKPLFQLQERAFQPAIGSCRQQHREPKAQQGLRRHSAQR